MTALQGEAALFVPGYERSSAVAPSDLDCLISGYRLTQAALLRDPRCLCREYRVTYPSMTETPRVGTRVPQSVLLIVCPAKTQTLKSDVLLSRLQKIGQEHRCEPVGPKAASDTV